MRTHGKKYNRLIISDKYLYLYDMFSTTKDDLADLNIVEESYTKIE